MSSVAVAHLLLPSLMSFRVSLQPQAKRCGQPQPIVHMAGLRVSLSSTSLLQARANDLCWTGLPS
eukprot:CAMPEP_0179090342 /NCGR_PEP_ID=MMETSP0796-20121207/41211_1 /TAXON_ID=73915 /ORGANISM="Pyrodinium bahamense, Strain pbaha01" /LENGTH=64 /DNA_ID=CAMNT_0020787911 /DNA_START=27 /DNA_END=218 /DNA_ORIENTATION=+